jgi:Xaa-Pro aminopeptidase
MVKTVKLGKGAERRLLGFENLTCAPYDLRLIDPKLLTKTQIDWLNDYHAWVKKALTSNLESATKRWLAAATKPIKD